MMQDPNFADTLAVQSVHDDVDPDQEGTMRRRQIGALLAQLRFLAISCKAASS